MSSLQSTTKRQRLDDEEHMDMSSSEEDTGEQPKNNEKTKWLNCQMREDRNAYEKMYLDQSTSDITLIIEGTKVPVHRIVLAADSTYFMRLFFGGFLESGQQEIEMPDISLEAFKICLQFMYFIKIKVNHWHTHEDQEIPLAALEHAHRFGLESLQVGIGQYLCTVMSDVNVLPILETAILLDFWTLIESAMSYIKPNLDLFASLKYGQLILFLEKYYERKWPEREVNRFTRLCTWLERNAALVTPEQTSNILSHVKLEYMTQSELINVVKPSNLFDEATYQATLQSTGFIVRNISHCDNPEYLQATSKFSAFSKRLPSGENGFMIELETEKAFNNIRLNIMDLPERWNKKVSGYKIAVSTNATEWTNVIDYSAYACKGLQTLYFSTPIQVKFIKIIGNNSRFHCNEFKVDYVNDTFKVIKKFVCPPNLMSTDGYITAHINYYPSDIEDDSEYENYGSLLFDYKEIAIRKHVKEFIKQYPISDFLKTYNEESPKTTSDVRIFFSQPYYVNVIQFRRIRGEKHVDYHVKLIQERNREKILHKCKYGSCNEDWHEIKFPATAVIGVAIVGYYDTHLVEIKQLNVYYEPKCLNQNY